MSKKNTLYEYPLSERIRTLLRMEHLFIQLQHYIHGRSVWDSRVAIITLFDILDILSRSDIRNEVLKEAEGALNRLKALDQNPNIDTSRLDTIVRALERVITNIHALPGQPGNRLKEIPLLNSIRQRCTIPGGTCDFDLPVYHQWLEKPLEERQEHLNQWFHEIEPLQQAIELVLKLVRNSTEFKQQTADRGSYLQTLDNSANYQLIRVSVPHDLPWYAEISGSKHRFTLRFLKYSVDGNRQAEEDIPFRIAICQL